MAHRAWLSILLLGVVLVATACGEGEIAGYEVSSETVSNESTQDILVLTPQAEGSWPVVILLHGLNGVGEAMAEIGSRLAAHGLVVFAPTYRTDMSTEQGMADLESDITCAYRYAIANADRYNGALDQPITVAGWSLGATSPWKVVSPLSRRRLHAEKRYPSPKSWWRSPVVTISSRDLNSPSTPPTGGTRTRRCC